MIKDILQIPIAVTLFLALIFVLLHYVNPRRNQAEFIIYLLNKLSEKDGVRKRGGEICSVTNS